MIDTSTNRQAKKWTRSQLLARFTWDMLGQPIFRITPRQLWVARRVLLRVFGASVHNRVHIYPTVKVVIPWHLLIGEEAAIGDHAILYALGEISIGARATVSQRAHICAGSHDHNHPAMPLLKTPISIEEEAWVCADAFVGPGVTIGKRAVVGARSVVMKSVVAETVVAGNPASKISERALENHER
ncbi:MAG: hypothetical protein AAFR51_05350 [Pseudomonadota bacterium]